MPYHSAHHPYSQDPQSSYQAPTPYYAPTPFDPSTPPPPPPKPSSHGPSRLSTPQTGPPLPPPPPEQSSLPYQQQSLHQEGQSDQSQPQPPPSLEDGWLPDILKDKSKADLAHLLSTPSLLSALINAPSTTHPSLPSSLSPLSTLLTTNLSLSHQLLSLSTTLTHLRSTVQSSLLHCHALERQWRQKQSALDNALEPFSHRALHQRLVNSIAEQEAVCEALEESFLEGEGRAGEREVGDFLKRFREGRRVVWVRKERKERWDEGRVGGWR